MEPQNTLTNETYIDISSQAHRAGIPVPTKATAALLKLFAADGEESDDEGWPLNDVLWAARSMLTGNLSCQRYRQEARDVFRIDLFCFVASEPEPVEVHLEAVRGQNEAAETLLWRRLAQEN
jgi:hypothetical protein